MGLEIERKFLVRADELPSLEDGVLITQGYIAQTEDFTVVRVRLVRYLSATARRSPMGPTDKGYITIKGANNGISRSEYEYSIPVSDASEMLAMCNKTLIKTRFEYDYEGHTFEIDVFRGDHTGLIVCEVELDSVDEELILPSWIATEVSDDPQYYNSNLI